MVGVVLGAAECGVGRGAPRRDVEAVVRVDGSPEPRVAPFGVTDQTGPEGEDPGESGRDSVTVNVTGDKVIGE